ncbi:hypothetical protein CASFOL_021880 [Castilleja foliolosa]|uniref:F-box domain-containing protein n=1 Tax=Castilleja foliolosa TaxID=1961234 RepID=A0ABD3D1C2_9LAMI
MNARSVKRRRVDDDDGSAIAIDRLSQLPQPILHSILSLLSQRDAIRTCVLSKSWRYLWHGRLNVEFRHDDYRFTRKNDFWPFLDKTLQSRCSGLKSIKLHKHHKIKSFACSVDDDQTIIEFEDPHPLESVCIQNCLKCYLRHKNMHFTHLKSLDLYRVAETFDNFSSFFPCLSELILDSCDGLKEFRLFSSSIKRLTIKMNQMKPGKGINAFIDTPNILYFEYSCYGDGVLPSIKFTTTSNEWKSNISLSYKLKPSGKDTTSWFFKLNKLLTALSQSHITLNLFCSKCKKLDINGYYGGFYKKVKPVVVEDFKLFRCLSPPSGPVIFDCFFRICRPRYIHIEESANNELVEFICNLIPKEKGSYSWLQDLEEVIIEFQEMIEDGCHWVQTTSLSEPPNRPQIRFRLTWREHFVLCTFDDSYGGYYKPVVVEHFKICGWLSPSSDPAMLNCFFRIIRPRYIHLDEYAIKLAEFMCNLIPKEKGSYFWLQDLEEVRIEIWDMKARNWKCVQRTSLPPLPSKQPIRFRLTWRKQ